jgi:hypothetical protein
MTHKTPFRLTGHQAKADHLTTMASALILVAAGALAGNPLVPHVGMADPNLHFFNGSWHIFATHDFNVNNSGKCCH